MKLQSKPLLVTVEDTSRAIGKGKTTVFALLKAGEFESVLIGRSRMIVWASLEAYVDRLRDHSSTSEAA